MDNLILNTCVFFWGASIGSFINLCLYRIPNREPIFWTRSHCDYCTSPLNWMHKFPALGFIILKGRSRCCNHPISISYFISEIMCGILFLFFYHFVPLDSQNITWILFTGLLFTGALIDIKYKLLPNKITLTGMSAGLLLAAFFSHQKFGHALLGVFICGGFLLICGWLSNFFFHTQNAMGGGDIKFAAMIGAFLGWKLGLTAILVAAFAGTGFGTVRSLFTRKSPASSKLVFGPFLAIGALTSLFWGKSLLKWYFSFM